MRTALVTDTTTDFPVEVAARLGIETGEVVYILDRYPIPIRLDLDMEDFLRRVEGRTERVSTAGVNAEAFTAAYERALARAPEVLCVTMPKSISSTWVFAGVARDLFDPGQVEVFDSRQIGLGQAALVLLAAEWAQAGATRAEIVERLAARVPHTATYMAGLTFGITDEIGRLRGRAGDETAEGQGTAASQTAGYAIQRVGDGEFRAYERVADLEGAVRTLIAAAEKDRGNGPLCAIIEHVHAPQTAQRLAEAVQDRFPGSRVEIWDARPTVTFFGGGRGSFGFGFCPLE